MVCFAQSSAKQGSVLQTKSHLIQLALKASRELDGYSYHVFRQTAQPLFQVFPQQTGKQLNVCISTCVYYSLLSSYNWKGSKRAALQLHKKMEEVWICAELRPICSQSYCTSSLDYL